MNIVNRDPYHIKRMFKKGKGLSLQSFTLGTLFLKLLKRDHTLYKSNFLS